MVYERLAATSRTVAWNINFGCEQFSAGMFAVMEKCAARATVTSPHADERNAKVGGEEEGR